MLEGRRNDAHRLSGTSAHVTERGEDNPSPLPAAALWWTARCVACGAPSATGSADPACATKDRRPHPDLPSGMPPLELCDEHWAQYETDWFLLGWCDGHYGEALRFCRHHQRTVDPL